MNDYIKVTYPKALSFVLMLTVFLGLFNETALNMALTEVMEFFNISASQGQWLTTIYLLVIACSVPLSSYLVKWFSTKALITTSLILSLIGGIIGAIAQTFYLLLIARVLQAFGTGIAFPLMMTVLMLIFPIKNRGKIMGIMGLVITLGPALGPTLSGFIISLLNWHYIFWISVLLFALLLIVSIFVVENVIEVSKPKIDLISIFLSTLAFASLILGFGVMSEHFITDFIVWLPLLIGIIALTLFVIRQLKLSQPMLNVRVFKYPMFSISAIIVFITMLCILSLGILFPLFLKGSLLLSAITAGFVLLPANLINIFSPVSGTIFDHYGAKLLSILGFISMFLSSIIFFYTIDSSMSVWSVIFILMLFFLGITMVMTPTQTNGLNQLPNELYPDGSASITTLIQLGGAMGTAISITVYSTSMRTFSSSHSNVSNENLIAYGVKNTFVFLMAITIIGFILSLFIKREKK